MAGITLAEAETNLTAYLTAESAVLLGQSSTIDGRTLTMADMEAIQKGVALWEARVARLSRANRIPLREVIPQ